MDTPLTLGTAGHVDHGKTALVTTLTGVDTDRLPEEKSRGLTIELGYAPLVLPSGRRLSLIDVPGHMRFVRTMVSGVTGIDLFLMVVASDDGVMPQTLEHADVLRALGVEHGVIAITKIDLIDPTDAAAEAAELLPGIPIVPCSARTGAGVDQLRAALERVAASAPSRATRSGATRLHVDRVFIIPGRGTVVTGTLWTGAISASDALELLPRRAPVRIRSVEVHGRGTELAAAGQRVAVNLVGVRANEVARGDVLVSPGEFVETSILDCALELRGHPAPGEPIQVLHGTRAVIGRAIPLGDGRWQLRLERSLVASTGDRFVVRRVAPPHTLGGGVVLDANARRHGPGRGTIDQRPNRSEAHLRSRASVAPAPVPVVQPNVCELERRLREAGAHLISEAQVDSREALRTLRDTGVAIRVSGRLYGHADAVAEMRERIIALILATGPITLASARDALGISRKEAQAFLEHLDGVRVTRRLPDDTRVLTPYAIRQREERS